MAEMLKINLLGKPQAVHEGKPLTGFISAKAEALFYYMAMSGQPHSRDILADLFWGEMAEASAKRNLTKALSNLRRLVGHYLLIDYQAAGFDVGRNYELDVRSFQEIALATEPRLASLRQAVALYRGDFLEGFFLKDAPVFEEWVMAEQQRLRELLLQTLERLATRLANSNEYTAAIDYVARILNLDPYREPAHQQMMVLLAKAGQRSAALVQYETCRRILAEELGAEPLPETRGLYERLTVAGTPPPHNLPHPSTAFVGREAEMAKIVSLLDDPICRLLTIAGPGGIGKTHLALQVAVQYVQPEIQFNLEQRFSHGVYWVRLAPLDSSEAIVPTMAKALGFSFQPQGEPQQQLLNYLRQKSALLILDNFEQLLVEDHQKGTSLIIEFLESAPGIKFLITSRTRLNVQGEHLFYLAGMDYPEWVTLEKIPVSSARERSLEDVTAYDAVRLFLQSARRIQVDFEVTPNNLKDILQICRLLQGMPLGILLAAAWVELLTPAEIAAEISRSLDFLTTNMRDLPDRQRSIRAAFDHSWELLTGRERELFAQLSIFRGHFSRLAAQTITDASLPDLMVLVNKSLLRHTSSGTYLVPEVLRQFAVEKLDRFSDGGRAARSRHSSYYTTILETLEADMNGPKQRAAMAQSEVDGENIRVAWQWAVEQGEIAQLKQAMDGLGRFYSWQGRYHEGEAAFRLAAQRLAATESADGLRVLARLLAWQGVFNLQLGLIELATQLLEKSQGILEGDALAGSDLKREQAFVWLQMGEIVRESDRNKARQLYEQSLALYQALDDRWGTANTLASLGWLVQHLGAYDEAKQLYEKSLTLRQSLVDRWGMGNSLMSLGSIVLYQGYPEEAERLVRQSISLRQELGDRAGMARSLSKLGEILTWLGKFAQAQEPLAESRAIHDNLGLRDAAAFSDAMLGNAQTHLGNYEQACNQAQLALAHFQENESQRGMGYALLVKGWAMITRDIEQAQDLLQQSMAFYQEIGQRDELAQVLALLGYVAYQSSDLSRARQRLAESLRIAAKIHAFMPMMLVLPAETLLLMDQGNVERAVELYTLASRYPFVANSRWFEDKVGQWITTAAAALPSKVMATIQERARTKALDSVIEEILSEGPALPVC